MHDHRPGKQRRFRHILFLRQAFGIFRDEITIRLLRLQPFPRAGMFAVQRCMNRLVKDGFFQIMIADACLDILRIEDKEMPLTLAKGGFIAAVDHHMIQRPAHEGRQLANGLGGRGNRFQGLRLGFEFRVRPQTDRRAIGIMRGEDECLLGHQLVGAFVRHFGGAPSFKDQAGKGTIVRGGDKFMVVRHHRIRIEWPAHRGRADSGGDKGQTSRKHHQGLSHGLISSICQF